MLFTIYVMRTAEARIAPSRGSPGAWDGPEARGAATGGRTSVGTGDNTFRLRGEGDSGRPPVVPVA
jgi:hypothetical protein